MAELFLKVALLGDAWVLYVLVLSSVLSLAVMVDRWRAFRAVKGDIAGLLDGLAARLELHDLEGAEALASASPAVEARVALAGLKDFPKGPASVEEVMASRWLR